MLDIEKLKSLVTSLEKGLEFKTLTQENIGSLKCDNGIYLIKDDTENRVVRVGINKNDNGLKRRISKLLQNKESRSSGNRRNKKNTALRLFLFQTMTKEDCMKKSLLQHIRGFGLKK